MIRKTNSGSSHCTFRKDGALQNFSKSVVWWLLLMLFRIGNFVAWKYEFDILDVEDDHFQLLFFTVHHQALKDSLGRNFQICTST